MADFYVSSTATGSGVGSEGDPFTITQAFAKADYAVGDFVWIKTGTYTITASLDMSDTYVSYLGYQTVIGDLDNTWGDVAAKPLIQVQAASGVVHVVDMSSSSAHTKIMNLVIDATNASGDCVRGGGTTTQARNCVAKNSPANGYFNMHAVTCIADTCNYGFLNLNSCSFCLSEHATLDGFKGGSSLVSCVSYDSGDYGFVGTGALYVNCLSIGNAGDGFRAYGPVINCISVNNIGNAYDNQESGYWFVLNSNEYNSGASEAGIYFINKSTADPDIQADYSLGNTNLYGLGAYIGSLDGTGTLDLGAIQKSSGVGSVPAITDVRDGVVYGDLTGSLDLPVISDVKTGVDYDNSTKTGTYDGSDRWTDPSEDNVKDGVEYKANSLTNNKTGNVTLPAESEVEVGVDYGTNGTEFTGTYVPTTDYPSEDNVKDGVSFGSGLYTGNVTLPVETNVKEGTTYGANGTEYESSYDEDYPAETDVKDGVAYGNATYEGNVTLPSIANTKISINYGANGSEYTGTLESTDPGIANVISGITYKIESVDKTGTFNESARNVDPGIANVSTGITYKILNVDLTGNYTLTGIPVITNIVVSDYTPTTLENIEITADITNSPDYVDCTINGVLKKMTLKTGTTYTTGLVQARYFGICEDQPIIITATNANGGAQANG